MNVWTSDQVKKTLADVYKKAATDEAFRHLCLQDPGEAVRQIAGQALPENFKLRFVDNAGADLTLVLPDLRQDDELSEGQLNAVAGGFAGGYSDPIEFKTKDDHCRGY